MKKLTNFAALFVLLAACLAGAQISDITSPGTITLTSTCTNLHTTCDTAGVTNFNINSPFNVQGPQTIEVTTQGYGLATVSVTGTYSGSTLNFDFSDDGGNTWYQEICTRTDANIQEASEVLPSNATEAWDCGVGAATKFRVRQSALSTGAPTVRITLTTGLLEPAPSVAISATIGTTDPCMNPGVLKQSVPINITTATTTSLVAASGTTAVYVCSYSMTLNSIVTTATTAQLEYGTGGSCTGTNALTGLYGAGGITAGVPIPIVQPSPLKATPAANGVCLVSAGATVNIQGVLTYVQQ